VQNLQPCIKFAFDFLDLQHFGAYTWMHRQLWPIAAALFQAPNDYIGVGPITANHAKELSCQMSQMRKDKAKI
jgi:hypothetical protein